MIIMEVLMIIPIFFKYFCLKGNKSPDRFEERFEDDSYNNSDFSERKKQIHIDENIPNQGRSHFAPGKGQKDKFPVQIIKFNPKKNIFEFNDQAEEVFN